MRKTIAIAVAVMLLLAGCSQAPGVGTTATTTDTGVETTAQSTTHATTAGDQVVKPDDPQSDVIGWEGGVWYNETIAVNPDDGLNDTEIQLAVNRTMARVERIRHLEFKRTVPVDIVTRDEFRKQENDQSMPADRRLFDNAKFEALFMIGESTDSIGVQNHNSGSSVGGFYSPAKKKIVVISENSTTPTLNEPTLAHELTHALQDQYFGISSFNQSTRELHNAKDGIIEGDANYVEHLFKQRCANQWDGDCFTPSATGSGSGGGGLANIGPYLIKYQPYSDGPAFVRGLKRKGGWSAVNDVYRHGGPASTEQVIHPRKYPDDTPTQFSVDDSTSDGWTRLEPTGRPNYASLGESGIFSMFMYPSYASHGQTNIVPRMQFFNTKKGSNNLRAVDPLNYNSSYSDGWDGDKLVVYANDDAKSNETAYVWKSVWDSKQDADEFVTGYRKLLQFNDATAVDGRAHTWRIEGNGFADAFYVHRTGKTVVIVNAPAVDELSDVHAGAAPEQ